MSIINNICEHGHLQRKCEVCDLRAEIARLRSVCRMGAWSLEQLEVRMVAGNILRRDVAALVADLADAGKEPSDGL